MLIGGRVGEGLYAHFIAFPGNPNYDKQPVLFQSDFIGENTVYEVRYDFVLGEDITIPANCVLEFDGGSLSGAYTLTGNNTKIQASKKIFDNNIIFAGTWKCSQIESYWWNIREDDSTYDNAPSLQKGIDLAALNDGGLFHISGEVIYVSVVIADHTYYYWFCNQGAIELKSNVHVLIDNGTTIKAIDDSNMANESHYSIFHCFNVSNVTIEGGNIVGDTYNYPTSPKTGEEGYGIGIYSANNVSIKNVNISYCRGDGIYVGRHYDLTLYPTDLSNFAMIPHNIYINNCDISYSGRHGIGVGGIINGEIHNCFIHNIGSNYRTILMMGIDVEPNASLPDEKVENFIVDGVSGFSNILGLIMVQGRASNDFHAINNIKISNCVASNDGGPYGNLSLRLINAYNTMITHCTFTRCTIETYYTQNVPTQISNCQFEAITIAKGANNVCFQNCSVRGDLWDSCANFGGNNSYIIFLNCSFFEGGVYKVLDYKDTEEVEGQTVNLTYEYLTFMNCSFAYASNSTQDTTHATYINPAWGYGKYWI